LGFKAASQRIYDMAKANHRNGNIATAKIYYTWLAEEELVPEVIRTAAEAYLNDLDSGQTEDLAEEMYQEVLNARTATEAWLAAQEYKDTYVNHAKLPLAFESAGQRIYDMAITNHRKKNFSQAIIYYSYLIEEKLVPSTMRTEAEFFLEQAEAGLPINTADNMYAAVLNANTATESWIAAQDFKKVYPNSKLLGKAFEAAGNRIYGMGTTNHRKKNFTQAIYYYELITNEKNVPESMRATTLTHLKQAKAGKVLTDPAKMYQNVVKAKTATEAWLAAQEFKLTYPTDSLLKNAFSLAGSRLYSMGISNHQNGNFA